MWQDIIGADPALAAVVIDLEPAGGAFERGQPDMGGQDADDISAGGAAEAEIRLQGYHAIPKARPGLRGCSREHGVAKRHNRAGAVNLGASPFPL